MSYHGAQDGRRSWLGSSRSLPQQGPITTPPAPPLGALLIQMTPEECVEDEQDPREKLQITDAKVLASYNWVDANGPSIVFPGEFSATIATNLSLMESFRYATALGPSVRCSKAQARLW